MKLPGILAVLNDAFGALDNETAETFAPLFDISSKSRQGFAHFASIREFNPFFSSDSAFSLLGRAGRDFWQETADWSELIRERGISPFFEGTN